jgi:ABC-type molybdate transport system ATPase subunit
MIAGLEKPTAGDILIAGQVVIHLPPRARKIAMVFQRYALELDLKFLIAPAVYASRRQVVAWCHETGERHAQPRTYNPQLAR